MTVQSIKKLLNARVLGGEDMLDREVFYCLRLGYDE